MLESTKLKPIFLLQDTTQRVAVPRFKAKKEQDDWLNSCTNKSTSLLMNNNTQSQHDAWLQDQDDDILSFDPISESAAHRKIAPSALEQLKKMASQLRPSSEKREEEKQMKDNNTPSIDTAITGEITGLQKTQYIPTIPRREPISEAAMLPRRSIYQSTTDAPWDILNNASFAHMRQYNRQEPLCIRISEKLAWKLARDVEMLTGLQLRELNFKFFSPAQRREIEIPLFIDVNLGRGKYGATQTVICIS
jgi:hypothetical protein